MKNVNHEKLFGAIRESLIAIGSLLIFFFPGVEAHWNEGVGIVTLAIGLVWAFKTKTATSDMLLSLLRKVVTFVGVLLASKVPAESTEAVLGVLAFIVPTTWQWIEKLVRKKK